MPRRILLITAGETPQLVTETVYALLKREPQPWIPDEILIATTARGAEVFEHGREGKLPLPPLLSSKGRLKQLYADLRLPDAHVEVIESQNPYGGTTQGFGYGNQFGSSRFDRAPAQEFKSGYQTPGWQRAKETWSRSDEKKKKQMTRGPKTIDGELVASSSARAPEFKVGTRVTHEKFGVGTVTLVDGNKLTIQFDDGDTKRVVASFVERVG